MDPKGITVKELSEYANKLIEAGMGDKHVLISSDYDSNGFHPLIYSFTTCKDDVRCYVGSMSERYRDTDPNEVVLLG